MELYRQQAQTPLVIAGAGGLGREIAWLVEAINHHYQRPVFELRGFLAPGALASVGGYPVWGDETWAEAQLSREVHFVVAVGNPILRHRIAHRLAQAGFPAATLIHPSVHLGPRCQIWPGAIIAAGSTLTVDIEVGTHVLVNLHCTIGHDVRLGASSSLAPGVHLSGATTLGEQVEIGTGAVVLPGLRLGPKARLGAGAVLTRSLPAGQTWAGVPAQLLPGKA